MRHFVLLTLKQQLAQASEGAIFAKPDNLLLVMMIDKGFYRFNSRKYSVWSD